MVRFLKFSFIILLIFILIGFPIYYFYFNPVVLSLDELYEIEHPVKKDVKQIISATGTLKLKGQVKIGSLVNGRVKALYIEEGDSVEEGQLLVEIETRFGDTEVREALGAYEKALAELEYQQVTYQRKKKLFDEQFLSNADLQEAKRNYLTTLADVKALKASYEKNVIAFENHKIYAPSSGVVIHLDVTKGEKVSSDLDGGILLSLAPDIKQIEAELEISEKDIGQIQKGQKVHMVVDTYPNKTFESTIHNISFTPKTENDQECIYQAKAYIDNPHFFLRPGMSVNAKIDVAAIESVLTLTSRAFLIKQEHLESIAQLLNYQMISLEKADKQALIRSNANENFQFIWAICNNCFKEIAVKVGITDNISFEIKSGLEGDEKLVVDVMEDDEMQKIYENFYRKL